jgi:hypothetical protein
MPRALIDQYIDCYEGNHGKQCHCRPENIFSGLMCDCLCHHEKRLKRLLNKKKAVAKLSKGL